MERQFEGFPLKFGVKKFKRSNLTQLELISGFFDKSVNEKLLTCLLTVYFPIV